MCTPSLKSEPGMQITGEFVAGRPPGTKYRGRPMREVLITGHQGRRLAFRVGYSKIKRGFRGQ